MSIDVNVVSSRPDLDKFINMWGSVITNGVDCTIKVLMIDYPEKKFTLGNGIKVEYIKQKTFPKTTFMNQAWARNELLCYDDAEYILFFDDWQRPSPDILVEHLNYLGRGYIVSGRRMECNKDGNDCRNDSRGDRIITHDPGLFWTCNASVRRDNAIGVNGFDNYFCGGSAGEDYDFGIRVARSGITAIYNPNAISYHYCHDHIPAWSKETHACSNSHNLSPYKHLPEYQHFGDWNLMTGNELEFWWEGPIKYYKCKKCGIIGILDSMQVYHFNQNNRIIRVSNGLDQVRQCLGK